MVARAVTREPAEAATPAIAARAACLVAVAVSFTPAGALAQVTRAQIEDAAATRLELRAGRVLACAPGMASFTVDVRFGADGAVRGVDLGLGAPAATTACVANALGGVALPGAVADDTVVRHVFYARAQPAAPAARPWYAPAPPPRPAAPPARPWYAPAPPPPRDTERAPVVTQEDASDEPTDGELAGGLHSPALTHAPSDPSSREPTDTARIDVGRYVVEVLVGGAAGAAVSYGVYSIACGGDNECFGAALAGLGANVLVTPLAIWGVGRAMGGRGDILFTYLGGMTAFAGASAPDNAVLAVAIGTIVLPLTSALLFEFTSQMTTAGSAEELAARSRWRAGVSPIYGHGGIAGANVVLGRAF